MADREELLVDTIVHHDAVHFAEVGSSWLIAS
jgi:hypothetical protein